MNAVNYGYSYATLQGIYEKLDANNAGDSDKLKLLEKLGSSRDGALISKNGDSYDTYTKTTLTDTRVTLFISILTATTIATILQLLLIRTRVPHRTMM